MIRLYKIETPQEYSDFENGLFSGGQRIDQFDFANNAVQINDIWYDLTTAVMLKNEDVAKPLALNVIKQWVDEDSLEKEGQIADLVVGAKLKTDTTKSNDVEDDRHKYRFFKGYTEIRVDMRTENGVYELLPQMDNKMFYIDSLGFLCTKSVGVSSVGSVTFSDLEGAGEEEFSVSVNKVGHINPILLSTGYTGNYAIDLRTDAWTLEVTNDTGYGTHEIAVLFDGKIVDI